jgi:hypothetical protein
MFSNTPVGRYLWNRTSVGYCGVRNVASKRSFEQLEEKYEFLK